MKSSLERTPGSVDVALATRLTWSPAKRSLWRVGKRTLDVTLSFTLLVLSLPLLIAVAVAIKLESSGPVFYRVHRVGYRGRKLMMLKFRKMHDDAADDPLTVHADPRLTQVGAILARTKLDELPQLWDVLCGRMSIIGPRPEDPRFVSLHIEAYAQILAVRPGITGLAQLAYAEEGRIIDGESPIEDYVARIMPQKLTLDKLYALHSSPRVDAAVVCWTIIGILLRRPVAVSRSTGRMNVRRRRGDRAVVTSTVEHGLRPAHPSASELVAAAGLLSNQPGGPSSMGSTLRLEHHEADHGTSP